MLKRFAYQHQARQIGCICWHPTSVCIPQSRTTCTSQDSTGRMGCIDPARNNNVDGIGKQWHKFASNVLLDLIGWK